MAYPGAAPSTPSVSPTRMVPAQEPAPMCSAIPDPAHLVFTVPAAPFPAHTAAPATPFIVPAALVHGAPLPRPYAQTTSPVPAPIIYLGYAVSPTHRAPRAPFIHRMGGSPTVMSPIFQRASPLPTSTVTFPTVTSPMGGSPTVTSPTVTSPMGGSPTVTSPTYTSPTVRASPPPTSTGIIRTWGPPATSAAATSPRIISSMGPGFQSNSCNRPTLPTLEKDIDSCNGPTLPALEQNIEALVGRAMHRDSSIVSMPLKDGDVYNEDEFASKLWFSDVTADLPTLVQPHSDVGHHLEKAFGKPTSDLFAALDRRAAAYGDMLRTEIGTSYTTNSAENIETLRMILGDIWVMAKDVSADKAFSKAEAQLLPKLPLSLTRRLMKLFWELLPVVFYTSATRFLNQDLAQRLAQAWQWMIQKIADKAKIENHSGLKGYQSEQWWYLLLCQATGNPGLQLGKFSHKAVDHAWYAKDIMGVQVKQNTRHTEIANLSDAAARVRSLVPPMVAIVEAPCPKHAKDPITANLDMDAVGDANDSCCGAADALGLEHPTRLYTTPMLKAAKQMIYFGGNDPEYSILYTPENRARGVSLVAEQGKTLTPAGKTIADSFSEWPVNKFEVEMGSVLAPVWILHAPSKEEHKRDAAAESLGKNLEAFVDSFLPLPTNAVPSFVFADLNLYLFERKHAEHFHTVFKQKRVTCIRSKHFLTRKQVPLQDQLHKVSEKDLDEVEPLRDSMYIMIRWPERMLADDEEENAVWEALGLGDESSVGALGFGVGGETSLSAMLEGSLQIWDDNTPDVIATDHTVVSVKGLRLSVFNMDNIRTKSFRVEKDPKTVQDAWKELGVPEMKLSKWHTSENFLYEVTYAMWAHAALSILLELDIPVVRGQLSQIISQDVPSES